VIGYPRKICRSNSLPNRSFLSCGNEDIDAFIEDTKPKGESKKEYCDYFLEWIPYSHIRLIKNDPIAKGNYSRVFIGKWKPLEQDDEVVDDKELINIDIALKVLKESENFGFEFLNEFKIHYKFLGVCAIPFYGLTMHPEMNEYAMVMKRAIHGDLRKFIDNSNLSWPERVKILSSIAKSLNELHDSDIIHRDLHCGNILVDVVNNDTKIFISDFGFSKTIDSPSSICNYLVVEGTPKVYKNIMELCWNAKPSERPDLSFLTNEYKKMIKELSRKDSEQVNTSISECTKHSNHLQSNYVTSRSIQPTLKDSEQTNSSISECTKHSNHLPTTIKGNNDKRFKIIQIQIYRILENFLDSRTENFGQDDFSTYDSKLVNFSLPGKFKFFNDQKIYCINLNSKSKRLIQESVSFSESAFNHLINEIDVLVEEIADTNKKNTTYGGRYEFEFPKGGDFYIKTTTSSSASSTQNYVIDVDRDFFVNWGAVKEGSKVIIAQQKSTTEYDVYQLWHYDDGFLINKQTSLYLEPESGKFPYYDSVNLTRTYLSIVKAGSCLVLHHRRSGGQVANQKWTLTKEGRIALRNGPYVLEVKDSHVVLADASKVSKHPSQFIIIPFHPVEKGAYVVGTINNAFTFDKNKIDDYEKAEALIIVEESATPEKCQVITSKQKDDGSIELTDIVCNNLDAPKEEIITTIQKNIKNSKLKSPALISTAVNLSYLKKAAPKHEGLWRDKYNKAREYLSKQIGDANAEKKLLECANDYVIDNSIKKVIKDKKKNAVAKLQDSTTLEKCNDVVSKQNDDGSFEVSETICKEVGIPVDVVPVVKKETKNEKLKSPESELWWKTALTLSYLKVAAPDHKKLWEDKEKKAREYLSKQIGNAETEKELLDCTDRYVVDNATKKVEKDHKKGKAITIVQEAASPDKCQEIVSNQNDDGSIELDNTVCNELSDSKENIIATLKRNLTNKKLQLPELSALLSTAVNLSYLKNAAPQHEDYWKDKYNKAREYLSNQIGDKDAEEELVKCADEYVVDKVTDKVIEEKKQTVIDLKKDEIPKTEKPKGFFSGIYENATKLGDQIEKFIAFDKDKHDDYEKAEALIVIEESATPEKCKEIISHQNQDGSIELVDTVCYDLNVSKEEIITTIQEKTTNDKLKS
ncbi:40786_t:CDS:2, partial [Gigaspora margarita]